MSVLGKGKKPFKVLMCDGFALRLKRDIDSATMWNLIRHADGNVVSYDAFTAAPEEE